MSSPCYIVTLPVLPFCMGYLEEMLSLFGIPTYASTTQKIVCSFELSLFSCILTSVYQVIVRTSCAFMLSMPIILVVRQAILFRMTRRNKLQYLIHIQDWVKVVVHRRSNTNPTFVLFYLGVLPSLNRDCYRNCTPFYELLVQ